MRKHQTDPNWDTFYNFFDIFKVITDKRKQRASPRLEGTKEKGWFTLSLGPWCKLELKGDEENGRNLRISVTIMCQHECFDDCTADVPDGNMLMLPKLTPSCMDVRLEGEFFFWLFSLQWAGHLVFSISCSLRLSLTLSLPGQPWECSYRCTRLVVITWKEKRDVNMYRNILLGEIVGNNRAFEVPQKGGTGEIWISFFWHQN